MESICFDDKIFDNSGYLIKFPARNSRRQLVVCFISAENQCV
jgi:hypothetical protein